MKFSKKMDKLSSAIFTQLELKKAQLISEGKEVIDFSIGTPDIPPSPHVMEELIKYIVKPEFYRYAINDTAELTEAVIEWYKNRYGVSLEKDEVISLLGSQSGFTQLCLALIDPGDIV